MIGAFVPTTDARNTIERIQAGLSADSMGVLAAAAATTNQIKLGTAIIQTWPRPPVLIAQQTMAVASLAPGRFRLGIGPGTAAGMEPLYGVSWRRPMSHLRE